MTLTINETARRNFEWVEAMGWHNTSPASATRLALIASEIGEFANECRGDEPTEHAVEELADIVLRCLDVMVGLRTDRGSPHPNSIARHVVAQGNTDIPPHVGETVCWPVAMREPEVSLAKDTAMPKSVGQYEPSALELAWGINRTLVDVAGDKTVGAFGLVIRATMYAAKMLDLPLDMAIVAKLRRNEKSGNVKGRTT